MPRFRPLETSAPLLLAAAAALVLALWAGLGRAGWPLQPPRDHHPLAHGPLFVCGFLGTLIGLEKARAIDRWWGYLAPLGSAAGALLLILIADPLAARVAFVAASVVLMLVFGSLLYRHPDLAGAILLAGAVAWLAGNASWLAGRSIPMTFGWWMAFPVLTIVGERLELSRVVPRPSWAPAALLAAGALYAAGLSCFPLAIDLGLRLQGAGLLLIAAWLLRFDLAWRTVRSPGVHRYTALCLLAGFVWLALGGSLALVWGMELQGLRYDALVHTVLVGFVFGMIFGHAPIIAPMLFGRRLRFDRLFYAPLIVLQVSLALRFAADLAGWLDGRAWGALLNAAAVALFLATAVRAAVRGERLGTGG